MRHATLQRIGHSLSRRVLAISLMAMTLLTAGCGSLFSSRAEAPVTYVLRPAFGSAPSATVGTDLPSSGRAVAQVGTVAAAPGYATDAILATLPDRRLEIFTASRWPDALPRVVETLAVQALRAVGVAAHDAAAPIAATHLLRITVRRFDAEYRVAAAAPVARVVLEVEVLRRADRQVVEQFAVEGEATAEANRMGAIVAAFEIASARALSALAAGTSEALARNVIAPTPGRHSPATISH